MGENIKVTEQQSEAQRIREDIRHTERGITETVNTLQERLSPANLRRQGVRKTSRFAWHMVARMLEYAQRTSVQASVLGTGALLLVLGTRGNKKSERRLAERRGAAKAKVAKPSLSTLSLAAVAAKAFLGSVRHSNKSGSPRPGKNAAWRGLASAIGAGLGTSWFRHRAGRV